MFETILLPAISLGLSAASVPGPIQAYLLNTTLHYGWKRGLLVLLAPLIADGPIIFVTVFVLQQIPDWAIQIIRVGGGLLLLWIAWGAWQKLQAGTGFTASLDEKPQKPDISPWHVLGTAVAMNILSPGPYLFWSTVTGPLLIQALEISVWAGAAMLLGFYGTFLGGMAVLVLVFNRIGKIGTGVTRYILILTIALLVWFATQLIVADAFGLVMLHQFITIFIAGVVIATFARNWLAHRKSRPGGAH